MLHPDPLSIYGEPEAPVARVGGYDPDCRMESFVQRKALRNEAAEAAHCRERCPLANEET